ncbi:MULTISPECIES: dihydrofolate reductase family protein [unclassified Agrococcus]|uniref:dihydrofolate reductase family protein n=1 Tax=unclassified Agrococcus TaxID=2615065 RepID=UPI0036170D66
MPDDAGMGTITVEQIVSADGFAVGPGGDLAFFDAVDHHDDDRTDSTQLRWLETVDAVLLGRTTYEMFAAYWPMADFGAEAVADPISRLPKHVVSSTIERAPWGDGEIEVLRDGPVAAARSMRERYGSTVVWGSLDLADALLEAGLVDELRLRIVPVLVGSGRGFTPASLGTRRLTLREVEQHGSGHVTLVYGVHPA